MLQNLKIANYRRFRNFELDRLGSVNLLVGTNNSGKTSILEGIELLCRFDSRTVFSSILRRRGEWNYDSSQDRHPLVDVSHLFFGRDLERRIVVGAIRHDNTLFSGMNHDVEIAVRSPNRDEVGEHEDDYFSDQDARIFSAKWSFQHGEVTAPMTPDGFARLPRPLNRMRAELDAAVQFVSTNGMTPRDVVRLFGEIVLSESEEHVVKALRIIEPKIERLASANVDRLPLPYDGPFGIYVKLEEFEQRVPVGSLGDGMWRMLGLALALANARNGVILIDEIDTGLHYSVMRDMWKMVVERSIETNVQVFATTHSRDCYESLAAVLRSESPPVNVTIQRIDPGKGSATAFDQNAIIAAAERGIEIR